MLKTQCPKCNHKWRDPNIKKLEQENEELMALFVALREYVHRILTNIGETAPTLPQSRRDS